jgi:hypothetical protein
LESRLQAGGVSKMRHRLFFAAFWSRHIGRRLVRPVCTRETSRQFMSSGQRKIQFHHAIIERRRSAERRS